jgi:hypothetical protein
MGSPEEREIDEVFMVRTEALALYAALVTGRDGKSGVTGNVRFQDGNVMAFRCPAGDRAAVRKKLARTFEAIASYYGTEVFCRRFNDGSDRRPFSGWDREVLNRMN